MAIAESNSCALMTAEARSSLRSIRNWASTAERPSAAAGGQARSRAFAHAAGSCGLEPKRYRLAVL
jgi:hypothetical protein